jgi:hypothetical protein
MRAPTRLAEAPSINFFATFLAIRDLLVIIYVAWGMSGHADMPDILKDTQMKRIKPEVIKQEQSGILFSRSDEDNHQFFYERSATRMAQYSFGYFP